ncbi:erythroid differentiation-related factor 1 [Diorhabda carinulata]|uniref:erythroid differentiation-related factor 1 n=1 Tax=Diorhabda carinulata TaxID=1163345 RepID=UPI0025A06A8D|nr:erythroid differentiation-related factor 1 [Diorhabda carinulata]
MKMDEKLSKTLENEEIKSTAVVKYSLPKPAQFMKLQCNTDLNLPPSNWLSSSADSYGLQHVLTHPKGFSSFKMAQMFPDCVGEVDVVSDAENIKKLLKIPYHKKGHISMMVHRIENTLLIDEFDIYKHLLRTAETEWEWLRKFFVDNISTATYNENKHLYISSRRREALKEKSLVSKFLYHSLVPTDNTDGVQLLETNYNRHQPVKGPLLPEPSPSTECPDSPTSGHKCNRNVVWTFEDIEMFLGTDMPIFGGGTHPCISLRLSDMGKPINVLTGIDYWLDNLMSNVPEVVMCYHLNGIVQKYELIKTEDLPRMDNSKFSPKLIRDVAQSILSFLKSNATKAGHTYWLFKGKDEEVIKLYDLTSLCSEKDVEKGQNPFTIPVAMLLYRVARNMKHSPNRSQPGTIRMLLKNCIKLLPQEKYPEIVTSSLYMLSDLYVPAKTNPENPRLGEQDVEDENESLYEDDLSDDENQEEPMKILVLENNRFEKFKNYYKPPAPIVGGIEERCQQAIQYVTAGLNCLKYFPENKTETDPVDKQEEEIKMAKPFEPIPMPYGKLEDVKKPTDPSKKKKKERKKKTENKNQEKLTNALLPKNLSEAQPLPTWQENENSISWKDHLKTLLYEKAVLVYATLSEHHFIGGNYGLSLRYIGLLARCQLVMNKLQYTSNALRENCLLGRAGDCCIMMIQNWSKCETYNDQLHNNQDEDFKMMEQLEQDEQLYNISIGDSEMRCVFLFDIRTIEQILLKSVECYEEALKVSESDNILRRLANSLNEIGSYYLNRAKTEKKMYDITQTCKKAEGYLQRGLTLFENVKDNANIALLYTNIGHLYRLLAHANTPSDRGEITHQEKLHYNKAIINYKKALQVLGDRESCPGIWDAVKWELSTALFNMGWIMHENPPSHLSKTEAEKEVIETLQRALQYCDFDENNPKYPLYIYRAAVIHYRIGSLYHSHIWTTPNDSSNRKHIIQLAKINYEKAAKMYFQSSDALHFLTAQMQRFALSEYLAETTSALNIKIKHLQHCLDIVLELDEIIDLLINNKLEVNDPSIEEGETEEDNFKTCFSLLKLVVTRLQYILKLLVKCCVTKPPPNKDCERLSELYKKCYKISFELKENLNYPDLLKKLQKVLLSIKSECDTFKKNA